MSSIVISIRLIAIYVLSGLMILFCILAAVSCFRHLDGWRVTEKTIQGITFFFSLGVLSSLSLLFVAAPERWLDGLICLWLWPILIAIMYFSQILKLRWYEKYQERKFKKWRDSLAKKDLDN